MPENVLLLFIVRSGSSVNTGTVGVCLCVHVHTFAPLVTGSELGTVCSLHGTWHRGVVAQDRVK